MKRKRKTKIIATIGPASSNYETISELFRAGADIFRLNFSHGDHQTHLDNILNIRKLEKNSGRPISILTDLQGPKLRVGSFQNSEGVILKTNSNFVLDLSKEKGSEERVSFPHPELYEHLKIGQNIYINDGHLKLKITENKNNKINTKVISPGKITNNKGVNLPDLKFTLPAITEKDESDIEFALKNNVDWIALSFVQHANDILNLKKRIDGKASVIAKLEKPSALKDLDNIIKVADGIMIARGDLGIEVPLETVPVLQKKIIRNCRRSAKPSIVATQMLESMITSPIPTRAESSDVATAVYDGADAVMLSAETAIGRFPLRTVETMNRIISEVENDAHYSNIIDLNYKKEDINSSDAIVIAAKGISSMASIKAIVTYTTSGSTTYRLAKQRPPSPILSITPSKSVARQSCLVWGVHSVINEEKIPETKIAEESAKIAIREKIAEVDDQLIITAGIPFGTVGSTNSIRLIKINKEYG
ncbi:MAG: pyruvate kinase [Alphaproteobacteria bacterium TMED87]|nr:pyruvate kinase [Rhodospirillaceae bacterium]OUV08398.1 MAG: pyruvate kinase [Alphaproteobacteria bacterium TMED87]